MTHSYSPIYNKSKILRNEIFIVTFNTLGLMQGLGKRRDQEMAFTNFRDLDGRTFKRRKERSTK